jgi:intracellular sulfur oxidation DsrE/DsrF family protein
MSKGAHRVPFAFIGSSRVRERNIQRTGDLINLSHSVVSESRMSKFVCALFAAVLLLPLAFAPARAADPHHLALQISDNDPDKMNAVLNVAANVSKYYSDKGEEVEIQIVAFNAGLNMLRADKSPVLTRLKSFKQGMPNVAFMACQNTLDSMTRKEGKQPPLVDNAKLVTAGVVTLIELGEKGWTIVRP